MDLVRCHQRRFTGVILETEGSVRNIQKRALFHYKTVKKGTPNLTSPFVRGHFTIVLMKQIFEKNKSLKAASGSWTQFKPEITPDFRTRNLQAETWQNHGEWRD